MLVIGGLWRSVTQLDAAWCSLSQSVRRYAGRCALRGRKILERCLKSTVLKVDEPTMFLGRASPCVAERWGGGGALSRDPDPRPPAS